MDSMLEMNISKVPLVHLCIYTYVTTFYRASARASLACDILVRFSRDFCDTILVEHFQSREI